jgi:uncharacterized phage-associated protein
VIPQPPASRSTLDVAWWFQARCESTGGTLSARRIHYLLYLTQAHYVAEHRGQKLMPATFLATQVGPVEPNIHQLLAGDRFVLEANDPPRVVEDYLIKIWDRLGGKTLKQLERLVERDGVWRPVFRKGALLEIPAELLFRAYGRGADAVQLDRRPSAGKNRNKEQEYWTLTGKKAEKWDPGLPGGSSAGTTHNTAATTRVGAGVRRILSAEEAQARYGAAAKTTSR